jgi:hypothetical protein
MGAIEANVQSAPGRAGDQAETRRRRADGRL